MDNNCPCEYVKQLQAEVKSHTSQLAQGNTNFALIQQDLGYIKAKLDKRDKFNSGIVTTIINAILTVIIGYMAVKLGAG